MHPHAEHRAHKVEKRRVAHIAKGYASGGVVATAAPAGPKAKPRASGGGVMRMDGGAVKHRADKRARGGKVKHKGTTVNVVVAGHGGAPSNPAMPMAAPPGATPPMPTARPPMMPPGPMPGAMPPPGAMPIRRSGGRAYASGGGVKSGPAWEEGVRDGTQPKNSPGKNDGKDVGRPRQRVATTYAAGGAVDGRRLVSFYAGGKVEAPKGVAKATKLPGGSGGGEARLAKEKRAERDYARP